MKKRFTVALLMAAVLLAGCGGETTSTEEIPTTVSQETEIASEITKEETEPENLYETSELITKTVGDIEYQIPKKWESDYEEADNGICYHYDSGYIWIWSTTSPVYGGKYSDAPDEQKKIALQQCASDAVSVLMKLKFGKASFNENKILEEKFFDICGQDAYEAVCSMSRDDGEFISSSTSVGLSDTIYTFVMFKDADLEEKIDLHYKRLVDSIVVKQNFQKTKQDIFENFKSNMIESAKKLKEDDATFLIVKDSLESTYYDIRKFSSFSDTEKSEENSENFAEFSLAVAYYDAKFDDESIGKAIGEAGWEAINSLMVDDGEFLKKMDKMKMLYEWSGNYFFENKIEPGQYKVGTDIESGEYVFFTDGSSGYFSVTSDANGKDIIANSNFEHNSIMEIRDGEYLDLRGCYSIKISDVPHVSLGYGTMFKIGTHLDAGEYKLVPDEEKGYYCVYGDSRQEYIVSNGNFSGQSYVSVSDGQYLTLSKCHIEFE